MPEEGDEVSVCIRQLRPDDLPFVVEQHLHHFPSGFFARLGPRFLTEYYRSFLTSEHACTLIASKGQVRVGFLVGAVVPRLHRSHVLRQHRSGLVRRAIVALLMRPRLLSHFLRTRARRYARKLLVEGVRPVPSVAPATPAAVLAHLAVPPEHQGRGVGSILIEHFERACAVAGRQQIVLVTEAGGPGDAYYRCHDWLLVGEHTTPDGLLLKTFARKVAGGNNYEEGTHAANE